MLIYMISGTSDNIHTYILHVLLKNTHRPNLINFLTFDFHFVKCKQLRQFKLVT